VRSSRQAPRSPKGVYAASIDPKRLRSWKWESANLGIATGAESGIVVIDIDDEAAWKALREEYGPHRHVAEDAKTREGKPRRADFPGDHARAARGMGRGT
jgi:hypothetical protein